MKIINKTASPFYFGGLVLIPGVPCEITEDQAKDPWVIDSIKSNVLEVEEVKAEEVKVEEVKAKKK